MRILIVGSKGYHPSDAEISEALSARGWFCTEAVCGTAISPDLSGKRWAEAHGITVHEYPVESLRKMKMKRAVDAALIFWDGKNRGAKQMIDAVKKLKIPVEVVVKGE